MAAVTISGTLTMVEEKRGTDPDYLGLRKYSPNTERSLVWLNCCLTDKDGKRFYFDGPKVRLTVSSCPGAAVALYHLKGEVCKWFREKGERRVATRDQANDNRLVALVKVGDHVTIRASVKAVRPTYTSINRVKLVAALEPITQS